MKEWRFREIKPLCKSTGSHWKKQGLIQLGTETWAPWTQMATEPNLHPSLPEQLPAANKHRQHHRTLL